MRAAKWIEISADGKTKRVFALFDTGATVNFIKKEIGSDFSTKMKLPEPFSVRIGGRKQKIYEQVSLSVKINQFRMPSQNFYIIDIRRFDIILGAFFMEQWGVILDPKRKKIKIKKEWFQLQEEY